MARSLAPLVGLPLLTTGSGAAPAIGSALLGLALGAKVDLLAFLTSRYLGQRAFGEMYGYSFMAFVIGSSAGAFIADVSFDRLGSYTPALIGFCVALMTAGRSSSPARSLRLCPPTPHRTGIRVKSCWGSARPQSREKLKLAVAMSDA